MGTWDLPDIHACVLGPAALRLGHIYQANPSCPCYNYYIPTTRSQSCMFKSLPKMLLEIFQNYTYFALHASHYACVMLQHEQN